MLEVCVVGAGVIGLASAVRLQDELSGASVRASVTVLAEHFSPHTTSDGAAGLWEPYMLGEKQDPELLQRWGKETFQHMVSLSRSDHGAQVGAFLVSGYLLVAEMPSWRNTVHGMRNMTEEELKMFPGHKSGFFYTTVVTEGRKYLPWLMKRFLQNGGKVVKKKLKSLSELSPQYDIVVVCCGLGSGELVGDGETYPVRGQVMRVIAPAVKHFVLDEDNDLYIIPCSDNVVLGGTHDAGHTETAVSLYHRDRILRGTTRLMPQLKDCTVQQDWVGLRPARSQVRLEKETINCGSSRPLRVVYNYGHGGAGVSLHWGCAGDAVQLVLQYTREILAHSKL